MSLASTVAAMAAAGCSPAQIAAVVKDDEDERARQDEDRRAARREGNRQRQATKRAKADAVVEHTRNASHAVTVGTGSEASHVGHAVTSRDDALHSVTNVTGVSLEVSPKDNNQTPFLDPSPVCETREPRSGLTGRELAAKADEFYAAYPKKVNPTDAKAKFIRVVKAGGDADAIIAATVRFAAAHRSAGTDKQFIPAGAVWLNRGGYDSEDLPEAARAPPPRAGPMPGSAREPRLSIFDAARNRLEARNHSPDDDLPDDEGGGIRRNPLRLLSQN